MTESQIEPTETGTREFSEAPRRGGRFQKKKAGKQRKIPLALKILIIFFSVVLGLALAAAITLQIMWHAGRTKYTDAVKEARKEIPGAVEINQAQAEELIAEAREYDNASAGAYQDKTVYVVNNGTDDQALIYNGCRYVMNENIALVLFMGVDNTFEEGTVTPGNGGQADCILLLAFDTETGDCGVLCFPRDSCADVDFYSPAGEYTGTRRTQLCLAYAYGDGKEISCQNTIQSVEQLLTALPIPRISSYVALDMEGVLIANDSIGGVTVTVQDRFEFPDGTVAEQGDKYTLLGYNAERYIRSRSHETLDSNVARMNRQKQYVQTFANQVTQMAKKDFSVITTLYNILGNYMVTNMGAKDVVYLASCYLDHGASFRFRTVKTESIEDVNGYAMYYLDSDDLVDCIIDFAYTPVK